MNGVQDWIGAVSLPILTVAILGLVARLVFGRKSSARRTAFGFATILTMAAFTTLPLWPAPRVELPQQISQIVVARSKVVEATFTKAAAPIPNAPAGLSISGLDILASTYIAGVAFLALRMGVGWFAAFLLRRKARPFREHEGYPVLLSEDIEVPFAVEGFRPSILVPVGAPEWSDDRLQAVLEHEASHLRRRDGLWLLLSNALCTLQWFNPFVWLVDRSLRRDLEFLADDEVLLKGAAPAAYAQSMLDLATRNRRVKTALAMPFAKKAGLKQRISAVIDSTRKRESVSRRGLAGTCLIALSCAAVGGSFVVKAQERVANPTSYAPDVRDGLTVPATASNDFVGILKDGRKLELVQVSLRTPSGVVSWKPNGDVIPWKDAVPVKFPSGLAQTCRVMLLRAETNSTTTDIEFGLGSGPYAYNTGEPTMMGYVGGGTLPKRDGKYAYAVSYIDVPKEDGAHSSFTASLCDAPWRAELTVDPRRPFNGTAGSVENLKVQTVDRPKTIVRDESKGAGPYQMITWTTARGREHEGIKITAQVLKDGKVIQKTPNGSYGGWTDDHRSTSKYYLTEPLANFQALRIYSRPSHSVEILNVRLKPN